MIRKGNMQDINDIIDLWQEMMDFHIQRSDLYQLKHNAREIYTEYIKNLFKHPDYIILVHEAGNKVVGYLIAMESFDPPVYAERTGLILEICVDENYRNKGIGKNLISKIEDNFIEKGIKRAECMVSDFNEVSKGFWFKRGYKPYNLMCVKLLS